ncbi:SAM-dependent methlyltransferase [Thioclava dalianensis]|uniref:SAM-dependent methlyltransferase n=1 Tax=Thioclava dalianensis TaxID=1185766 RepID=A0A074U5V1_9RHOB|nr:RsmB/NOP family class I SAM-dependent RNA methyltransferase [Thioclava dalianensis]KEP70027.1 SAM-dependent methlyltransferase [Thioclava dalianensis]SFN53240.1 16S rRNA (cytosine967-C5)-methyltransferase [Thioclava dalianensis]
MTPAARIAAAISLLDTILPGEPAERALTNWARGHRFAGSKDRAAIRDHVYDALRCRGSFAQLGGGEDGRALMLGLLRAQGIDPQTIFTGEGYGPEPLSAAEQAALEAPVPEDLAELDWPEWLRPALRADLGAGYGAISEAMRARAPVILRVNIARTDPKKAAEMLAAEGIVTQPHPLVATALEVIEGARKVHRSAAYMNGLVELQDAASQAATALVPLAPGMRVLDYCAGGGGKALALAAACPEAVIHAHDADPARLRDLPVRAARAGAEIALCPPGAPGTGYDLVVVDAPCSGSGTWRRTPEAKWRLDPARLSELVALQAEILEKAADLVADGGVLAYMNCSFLEVETAAQLRDLEARGWACQTERRFSPLEGADGFYVALLHR